jgi:hypothetical protein
MGCDDLAENNRKLENNLKVIISIKNQNYR